MVVSQKQSMMAKQQRGSKPRAVIGTHHGLMHGSQSHQQHFNRCRGGSNNNNTSISPKGSTRSSFSTFTNNRNNRNSFSISISSPKTSSSSNSSSLIGHGPYKVFLVHLHSLEFTAQYN